MVVRHSKMEAESLVVPKKAPNVRGKGRTTKKETRDLVEAEVILPGDEERFLNAYLDRTMDGLERAYHVSSGGIHIPDRLSTNSLAIDMCFGGGIVPGTMASFAGLEGASKSTAAMHTAASAMFAHIRTHYHDPEGAVDGEYTGNILRVKSLEDAFGRMAPDNKSWLIPPRIRYYDDSKLETFFEMNAAFLRKMPLKRYHAESDTWYYVFPRDGNGGVTLEVLTKQLGMKPNREISTEMKAWWCPTEKRGPQGLIICDSWPSLLSEDIDHDSKGDSKEKNKGKGRMAFSASKFSENLPLIVGKLRSRGVIVLGINQIRLNPQAYGNPEYEPAGNALKFYSSSRGQLRAKTVPHDVKSQTEDEPCAFGDGVDRYAYKMFRCTKNKHGTPNMTAWLRVWVKDADNQGRGYCPVWDTYQFMLMTGRVHGKRNKFSLDLAPGLSVSMTWHQFKQLILAETREQRNHVIQELKLPRGWIDVRKRAFAEVASGKARELLAAQRGVNADVEDLEE